MDPTVDRSKFDLVDIDEFVAALEDVRERGYAIDTDETTPSGTTIATPVVGDGRIVGAIGAVAPRSRLDDPSTRSILAREVTSAAESLESYVETAADSFLTADT
jgi:DNA-binding IclR family transcriptional regulator